MIKDIQEFNFYKNKEVHYQIGISILVVFMNIFFIEKSALPFISDEVGVWESTAALLGYAETWKQYNLYSGTAIGYYGILTSIIYLPALLICNDSITAYRLCLGINMFLLIVMVNLVYIICKKYFGLNSVKSAFVSLASVMQYGVLFYSHTITTETVFTLWFWFIIFFVLKVMNEKVSNWNMLILSAVLSLGYLIHSRFIVVFGIVGIVLLIYLFSNWKKRFSCMLIFSISLLIFLLIAVLAADMFRGIYWIDMKATEVINTPELVITRFNRLFSIFIDPKGFFTVFFSLICSFAIETNGLFVIYIIVIILYFVESSRNKRVELIDKNIVILIILSVGCFFGMIMCNAAMGHDSERMKTYVYTRYAIPFLGALTLCVFCILNKKMLNMKHIVIYSILGNALMIHWIVWKWPSLLYEATYGKFDSTWFLCYKIMSIINRDGKISESWLILFCIFSCILFIASIIWIYKNKIWIFAISILIASNFTYWCSTIPPSAISFSQNYYLSIDETLDLLEHDGLKDYTIYYYGTSGYFLPVQVSLYKSNPICLAEEKIGDIDLNNNIFLSNSLMYVQESNAKYIIKLGQNQYIGTSNDLLYEYIKNIVKRNNI